MYLDVICRHALRGRPAARLRACRPGTVAAARRRLSVSATPDCDPPGAASDPVVASPFILQSHEHLTDYERAINLSSRVLALGAPELAAERRRIAEGLAAAAPCADCSSAVERAIQNFRERVLSQVFTESSTINEVAKYVLAAKSKLFRPRLGLMVARVLSGLGGAAVAEPPVRDSAHSFCAYAREGVMERVLRLLQSYEIVHAGSLIHDDILDDAETRRSRPAVHLKVGAKFSVLVGDLLLTRACSTVANLGSSQSTTRMAKALENLIKGELTRVSPSDSVEQMLAVYLRKTFLKTASLIAECCASIADLFRLDASACHVCYLLGLHVGMAFQIYDDLLDYSSGSADLGKPAMNDLSSGLITMPLLLALPEVPALSGILGGGGVHAGNAAEVLSHVRLSHAFERSRCAVLLHLEEVSRLLGALDGSSGATSSPLSPSSQTLLRFVHDTVTRTKG